MPNDLKNAQTQVIRNADPQPQPSLKEEPRIENQLEIELVDWGKVRATANLYYGDFLIKGFKVVDPGDGKPLWVGMPSKQIPNPDGSGEQVWKQMVQVRETSRKRAFENFVLRAYREKLKEAGQTPTAA